MVYSVQVSVFECHTVAMAITASPTKLQKSTNNPSCSRIGIRILTEGLVLKLKDASEFLLLPDAF